MLGIVWLVRNFAGTLFGATMLVAAVPDLVWASLAFISAGLWIYRRRFSRPDWRGLPVVAAALGSLAFLAPAWGHREPPSDEDLKVLQLNMQHGLGGIDNVANLIRREGPDILFLQETGPLDQNQWSYSMLEALRPYELSRVPRRSGYYQFEAICVKGTIQRRWQVDLPEMDVERAGGGKRLTAIEATVRGKRLVLATVHLSPLNSAAAPGDYGKLARIRAEQWQKITEFISDQSATVIVAGDFNGSPFGYSYRTMAHVADDAFREAGVGLGYTLPSALPLRRIDYIWSRGLRPVDCRVLPDQVSDHRGISARFRL